MQNDKTNITDCTDSDSGDFTEREFLIGGKQVFAIFPKISDNKTMTLIKDILIDSHMKNAETSVGYSVSNA